MSRKKYTDDPKPLTLSNVPESWRYAYFFEIQLADETIVKVQYNPCLVKHVPGDERAPFDPYFEFTGKGISGTGYLRYDIPKYSTLPEIKNMPPTPELEAQHIAQRLALAYAQDQKKYTPRKEPKPKNQPNAPIPVPSNVEGAQCPSDPVPQPPSDPVTDPPTNQLPAPPMCPKCGHPESAHQYSKKAKRAICLTFGCPTC